MFTTQPVLNGPVSASNTHQHPAKAAISLGGEARAGATLGGARNYWRSCLLELF